MKPGRATRHKGSWLLKLPTNRLRLVVVLILFAAIGTIVLVNSYAATPTATLEAENGSRTGGGSVVSDTTAAGNAAVKFAAASSGDSEWPNASNRPHMISANVLAYTDANGTAQTVTLKPMPAKGSTFGTNASGQPNNGAYYDPRGWVTVTVAGTVIDGYNFDGVPMGDINVSNTTISRNWFHNIDGQDSWCIWIHNHGNLSGLTITDNLCHGTTGVGNKVLTGLVKVDGPMTNVVVKRNHTYYAGTFIQFAPIAGDGNLPYENVVADNYVHDVSDGGPTIGFHVEIINVSSGTGGLLIQHNHFTGPTGQTATIYICHDSGNVGNITIDNNWLDGNPQNIIYPGDTGIGSQTQYKGNIDIINNKIDRSNHGGLIASSAPIMYPLATDAWTGNVWYPDMTPINNP